MLNFIKYFQAQTKKIIENKFNRLSLKLWNLNLRLGLELTWNWTFEPKVTVGLNLNPNPRLELELTWTRTWGWIEVEPEPQTKVRKLKQTPTPNLTSTWGWVQLVVTFGGKIVTLFNPTSNLPPMEYYAFRSTQNSFQSQLQNEDSGPSFQEYRSHSIWTHMSLLPKMEFFCTVCLLCFCEVYCGVSDDEYCAV